MTSTTTEKIARVYVRRLGYASLLRMYDDHSVTVQLEDDGTQEHISFGDWSYDRDWPGAEWNQVDLAYRIKTALRLDFGKAFAELDSGVGDGTCWHTYRYGGQLVRVEVTPET